jgi:polar amino acid transport system substrate-binding protein
VFADGDYLMPIAEEDPDLMVILEPVSIGGGIGMGLREGDPLIETFDAAITSMKEDGSLNTMILEWFGEDAPTF